MRLIGQKVRDGHYHAWIERDDPRPLGKLGAQQAWSFPSFFSARSNVDRSSVSSLACGQRVVSVANFDRGSGRANVSSSQGPTRDGRPKPDIAALGTNVVAAKGFAPANEPWIAMTGTSMASPYVTGVAGLMLSVNPRLTAAQLNGILRRNATPLSGTTYEWQNDIGFGVIDAPASVLEAASFDEYTNVSKKVQ